MATDINIEKKLIINQFSLPTEMQDYIKDFVFIDPITSETKKQKKILSESLKTRMIYLEAEPFTGHWATTIETIQLQAVNCIECGNFIFANSLIGSGSQCRC